MGTWWRQYGGSLVVESKKTMMQPGSRYGFPSAGHQNAQNICINRCRVCTPRDVPVDEHLRWSRRCVAARKCREWLQLRSIILVYRGVNKNRSHQSQYHSIIRIGVNLRTRMPKGAYRFEYLERKKPRSKLDEPARAWLLAKWRRHFGWQ